MTIKIKPSKVGTLHAHLGVPKNKKIPRSKLSIKSGDSPAIRKKKQFAINARSWSHADGGLLFGEDGYQDYSFGVTNPDYAYGGNMYFLGGIKPPTAIQGSAGNVSGCRRTEVQLL